VTIALILSGSQSAAESNSHGVEGVERAISHAFLYERLDTNSPAMLRSDYDNIEAQPIKTGTEKGSLGFA
jgi:hypothetical protein